MKVLYDLMGGELGLGSWGRSLLAGTGCIYAWMESWSNPSAGFLTRGWDMKETAGLYYLRASCSIDLSD